ncbi:uncharacterized protein LOC122256639 [Penaeus japonicus]|uniref:uncharacterized protein LOC122256639 n=1 Tax=Penaeus japonicus TaxID=27405 RepID=UPI001C713FCC|nr:uncharacterized protein LOC122256639 [Penaeus japonicus]
MQNIQDEAAFRIVAQVLGVWHKDNRDHHHGLWRLPYHNVIIFIIGVPYSRYSKYVKQSDQILEPRLDLRLELEEQEARLDVVAFQAHQMGDFREIMDLDGDRST